MIALWCLIGLVIAAICVSTLGAAFSVVGLAALFSGAALAVCAMACSLEFAKFVLAAYLHQRWKHVHWIFKTYLLTAIVVLSAITSMGIFGFLSNAYQSASSVLEAENIKLGSLKNQQSQNANEIARLNKSIDEIPANRISKRLKARADQEPLIKDLNRQTEDLEKQVSQSNLKILEIKQKVGPLIYIARVFQMDIDVVVKYLIMVFVSVFDPLAICLVIASSEAIMSRKEEQSRRPAIEIFETDNDEEAEAPPSPTPPAEPHHRPQDDDILQMRFASDEDDETETDGAKDKNQSVV